MIEENGGVVGECGGCGVVEVLFLGGGGGVLCICGVSIVLLEEVCGGDGWWRWWGYVGVEVVVDVGGLDVVFGCCLYVVGGVVYECVEVVGCGECGGIDV